MADQPKLFGQRNEPPPPADDTLGRHGARILSPIKAPRLLDQPPQPTAYVADRLILPGNKKARKKARRAIKAAFPGIELEKIDCHLFELKDGAGQPVDPGRPLGAGYRIVPTGQSVVLPDAWSVLETARAGKKTNTAVKGASLDHLMFGPSIGGTAPYTSAHSTGGTAPYTSAHSTGGLALASYGQAGSGGRQVVNWVGANPERNPMPAEERPRVAFFDTGCGEHPWLEDGVERFTVGNESDKDDPEKYADQDSPLLGELDSHSGHGTFLAGIIRQYCPDADLMSIRVMKSDGVVKEWETLHALQALAAAMQRWIDGQPGIRVDIVVLSLGYYLETPIDPYYTSLLGAVLKQFGRLGVVVVVASGNDATEREFYPAAFSPRQDVVEGTSKTPVPVIAVGSLNPDENSIALFNNYGPWIRDWQPGVSLVSTVPKMQGSLQPQVRLPRTLPGEPFTRTSIDDDNFASGFALWSGTSFSAPLLAAKIADALIRGEPPVRNARAARRRGWGAVQQVTSIQLVPR